MAYPELMNDTLEALIMATKGIDNGTLFSRSKEGMQIDLLFKRIRTVISGVVKGDSSQDIKVKCVELLMRIGVIAGNPEDLILAAQYQFEFKIDISKHLGFILSQSEVYEEPKSNAEETGDAFKIPAESKNRIQNKCDYEGPENRGHSHDKMAGDGSNYFTYCDARGFSRATSNETNEWKIAKVNQELKELKGVSLLVHKDQLYIRHSGMTEEPFRKVDRTEMTINTEDPPIVAAADETPRFRWTTDENVEETEAGKRWMGVAPMASDGRYIYTLVMYREGDATSTRK